jgi:hypothetical protein
MCHTDTQVQTYRYTRTHFLALHGCPPALHVCPPARAAIARLALQQMSGMRAAELAAVCSALARAGMHNSRFMEAAAQQLVSSGGLEKLSSRWGCEQGGLCYV